MHQSGPEWTKEKDSDGSSNPADRRRLAGTAAKDGQWISPDKSKDAQDTDHNDPMRQMEFAHYVSLVMQSLLR
jgi:hypothetical protein